MKSWRTCFWSGEEAATVVVTFVQLLSFISPLCALFSLLLSS
jgi:hypothetical protein